MNDDSCFFCKQDYDYGKEWLFSSKLESFFHPSCLEDQDLDNEQANIVRQEVNELE